MYSIGIKSDYNILLIPYIVISLDSQVVPHSSTNLVSLQERLYQGVCSESEPDDGVKL